MLRSHTPIRLLEVGCGPGFYSRRLAARFPSIKAMGVDTSERLLSHARQQAHRANLDNCCFHQGDAQHLQDFMDVADVAIASRLFLILFLEQREEVMRAVYDTLRPGGLFFVAEPTSPLRTAVPLWLMRAADRISGRPVCYDKPLRCEVLPPGQFDRLIHARPWSKVEIWRDKRYQYALCEKTS